MTGTYSAHRSDLDVSFYIESLNSLPVDEPPVDTLDDTNLALFSNTSWFDFDMGQPLADAGPGDGIRKGGSGIAQKPGDGHLEFMNDLEAFGFPLDDVLDSTDEPRTSPTTTIGSTLLSPTFNSPRTSAKRKASASPTSHVSPQPDSFEEASRIAAEEDKRRRNTAASARFRVKKKQREQALERTAKDLSEKVAQLERKISQLELENKWLKNLIVEKKTPNGGKIVPALVEQDPDATFAAKLSAAMKASALIGGSSPSTQNKDGASTIGGEN